MRSVYHILQKLRDQEKNLDNCFRRGRGCNGGEANLNALNSAYRDNQSTPQLQSATETNWNEYLMRQRYFEVLGGESIQAAEEESNKRREALLEAQKESQIMEELIQSTQDKDRKQQQQEEAKVNDELGTWPGGETSD